MDAEREPRPSSAFAAAGILLLAAAFRFLGLADLPPGLHQDEAVYGANALLTLDGWLRMYYGEREPLYMYLVAATFAVAGPTPFALRFTSAVVGTIVVAATGALATRLFGRWTGLLAALAIATSLWLVPLSRIGFRAITFPAVETIGLALFWHATRTRRARDFALAGAVLGLSLYTYLAARFLPFAIGLFLAFVAILHRDWLRERVRGLAIAAVVALIVFLPLGIYFQHDPEALFGRARQVALTGDRPLVVEVAENLGRTVGMIAWRGDRTWRHNLSGAPVFDPIWAAGFAVGVVAAVSRRRPADLFALAVGSVLLLPSALSIDSPHYLRTLGAASALYALAGSGIVVVARHAWKRVGAIGARAIVVVAIATAVLRGGIGYFVTYAESPAIWRSFNAHLAAAGQYLATSPTWRDHRDRVVVTDRFQIDRASVAFFLLPHLDPAERRRWLDEGIVGTFFDEERAIPLYDTPVEYLIEGDGRRLIQTLGSAVVRNQERPVGGGLRIRVVETAGPPAPTVERPVEATFSGGLVLEGASVDESAVALVWQRDDSPPPNYAIFLHLRDRDGHVLEGADIALPSFVTLANGPRRFVTWHDLSPPPGTPPGTYQLEAGLYNPETGERVEVQLADRTDARVPLGAITLGKLATGEVVPTTPLDAPLWPGLTLLGAEPPPPQVLAGQRVPLTLYWRADAALPDLAVRIQLVDDHGAEIGTRTIAPAPDYPTSRWQSGDTFRQIVDVRTRPTAQGTLRVIVRVGSENNNNWGPGVDIGTIAVEATDRSFALPDVQHEVEVVFQDVGRLAGYDLAPPDPGAGGTLTLTLYWVATGEYPRDETVFVHLIDDNDQIRSQRDTQPVSGQRPTSTWVGEEVIADPYEIALPADLPAGTYTLRVGLYDQRSGRRVPIVRGAEGDAVDLARVQIEAISR